MWHEALKNLHAETKFNPGASSHEIECIAQSLKLELPEELADILSESNGMDGEYGLGLLWPAQRIIDDNLHFRSSSNFADLYMPFENLLFFGDAGNGDQFAFPILQGGTTRPDIFVWNHEDDSRTWIAPSLKTFYEWWLTGKITV